MSERQTPGEEEGLLEIDADDASRIADRIARETAPGGSNDDLLDTICDAEDAVREMNEDLNRWFEILDVRIYPRRRIGVPARFRWTIKRWVANDMDQWLVDNGWELLAHLKADSREHEDNEMEARYRKEFQGFQLYANFYVEFTEDVFESMQSGELIHEAQKTEAKQRIVDELRERRR